MKKLYSFIILVLSYATTYSQSFQNPSLESWGPSTTCPVNTAPDNWTNFSNTGVGPDKGDLLICPSTIPTHASDGHVYARTLAGNTISGEGMSQTISGFCVGCEYTLTFDYAGSNLWGGTDDIRFHIFKDGVRVDSTPDFHSTDTAWTTFYYYFNASSATHTFGFRCYTAHHPSSGGSGGIDNFRITNPLGIKSTALLPELDLFPNPFHNSLTIKANRSSEYEIILFDIVGRPVLMQTFSNSIVLNTESLAKGIYIYEVKNKNGIIKKGKVVSD